jgi:hypothetical protein
VVSEVTRNYRLVLDAAQAAAGLWMDEAELEREFRDGRVVSRFTEHWVTRLYGGLTRASRQDQPGFDCELPTPLFGRECIEVKCLTQSKVRFQRSHRVGKGRSCSREELLLDLQHSDGYIVVDVTEFPVVYTLPVRSQLLCRLVLSGQLTPSGLSSQQFYERVVGMPKTCVAWQNAPR